MEDEARIMIRTTPMGSRRVRLAFCMFVVVFAVGTYLTSRPIPEVQADIRFGVKCGPLVDCWYTTSCEPEDESRTQTYQVAWCLFGNPWDYCIESSWACFDVYSCPDEIYMGTMWAPETCAQLY